MKTFTQWLWNVLVAIDQLGNTLAAGNPDITISARVGFFANESTDRRFYYYWLCLERIIDFTFYPLDGPNHCLQSLRNDNESGHQQGSDLARGLLGIITIIACLFIAIITWTAYALGQRPPETVEV